MNHALIEKYELHLFNLLKFNPVSCKYSSVLNSMSHFDLFISLLLNHDWNDRLAQKQTLTTGNAGCYLPDDTFTQLTQSYLLMLESASDGMHFLKSRKCVLIQGSLFCCFPSSAIYVTFYSFISLVPVYLIVILYLPASILYSFMMSDSWSLWTMFIVDLSMCSEDLIQKLHTLIFRL